MDSPTDFEDEMLALNTEYDLIFSKYNEACLRESQPDYETRKPHSPNKMKIITKMNEIIGQKPIGELPTHSDWDEHDSIEKETISLMRKFGLEQSIDRTPDESRTISTVPTTEDVIIMRNGRKKMSIFMSDSFFQLKPRSEPVFCTDDKPSPEDLNTSSSNVSEDTSLYSSSVSSGTSSGIAAPSNVDYKYVSSAKSSDSSDLSWRRRDSPSSGSSPANGFSNETNQRKNSSKDWRSKNRGALPNGVTNWRSGAGKSEETAKQKEEPAQQTKSTENVLQDAKVEGKASPCEVNELENVEKKVEQPAVPKIVPNGISNCGSRLYKPKDLFLKKKAMLIQQTLSNNS